MRLLASVSDAEEAAAALDGGADIIDAKDPRAGPLGAVTLETCRAIARAVNGERPLTAALGDARDAGDIERAAAGLVSAGARLVKVGFAGIESAEAASRLLTAAVRGASSAAPARPGAMDGLPWGVVAAAYADHARAASLPPGAVLDAAARCGVRGVLLDTFDKEGPGLRQLLPLAAIAAWVDRARSAGLLTAVAGRLDEADLVWVRASGADVAGVRAAACEGGRTGRVTSARVRLLHRLCHETLSTQPT